MGARFCPYCGNPIVTNASFCASCGAALGGLSRPASVPGAAAPPGFAASTPYALTDLQRTYPSGPLGGVGAPGAFGDVDRLALSNVSTAAIFGAAGAVLSIAVLLFNSFSPLIVGTTTGGSGTPTGLYLSGPYILVAVASVGLVLTMLELWFYRQAFRTLAPHDPRFSTPSSLVLAALVAFAIGFIVVVALLAVIYQSVVCAGSGGAITSACINVDTLLGLVGVLLIAALVFLIGYIGLVLGIWRLGTRYGDGTFKAGAILLIFPILSVVGLILILRAARSATGKHRIDSPPVDFR